ncbi:MAG TPA: hydroxymethylbilane synthase [Candidatus Binatia bacterium]|nr:hydroxymethylbilane synthase [Candidatus Binatia bacterium]
MAKAEAGAQPLRLGTRGSALALAQSGQIARRLEALGHAVELVVIRTTGDKLANVSLAKVGGKGLFLKEIEEALAAGAIDVAVHSLKDVPADLARGFAIAAVPERADVRDVIVARAPDAGGEAAAGGLAVLRALPANARVATGSLRRRAQLRAIRADLDVPGMRGNVDTRLAKLRAGAADAIVLAAAGLARLGVAVDAAPLDPGSFLPAPGQGALALEVRAGDAGVAAAVAALDDPATASACEAERAFLRALGASCQVPVAAYARAGAQGELLVDGLVASLDGAEVVRERVAGAPGRAAALGTELAERVAARGGRDILARVVREIGSL